MRLVAGLTLALLLAIPQVWAKADAQATQEVEYLIDFVASSGCQFNRNGSAHDPEDAADHLRLKFRRGEKYVDTAEHFIDRLASESSWTGRDYTVNCESGTFNTGSWLHEALKNYRAGQLAPQTPAQDS
ncbi:MAG: DUF5329 domain-containing protein [Halioglobus sp.]